MFCGQCGQENPNEARFCQNCGRPLPAADVLAGGPPMPPAPTAAPMAAAPLATPLAADEIRALPASEFGGFWMRFAAQIIDWLIMGIVGGIAGGIVHSAGGGAGDGVSFLVSAAYEIAAPVVWGAHVGKLVFGYRLVTADGRRLTLATAVLRYFATYLSFLALFLGFITAAFDSRKQGWHDKIAGTYVVRAQHARA